MQRILIIKPSALGDVATTLPLLCDLRAALPDAQIDWLIHPAYAALIDGHDALHQFMAFDRQTLAGWWYRPRAFGLLAALLRRLRESRYHVVIDGQGLFRSAFLARVTRAPMRIGFADAREGAPLAYTHKVRLAGRGRSMLAVDRMRALGVPLGTNPLLPAQFRVPLQPNAIADADAALSGMSSAKDAVEASSPQRTGFVVVIPGARWDTKRWPIDRYAQIAGRLLDEGHNLVLLGSPDEKQLSDQLEQAVRNPRRTPGSLLNLAGRTSIAQMNATLARARLVIANDSGPLHIAAALGTPVVALYGPTSPDHVGPYAQSHRVLRHDVPCHPCRLRQCDHHSCMRGLDVESVWEMVRTAVLDGETR